MSTAVAVSPLFLDRYELKYVIPFSLVEPITNYLKPFCNMDYYSQISHDGFYTINSLYLDTPTRYLLRQKINGNPERFSMRVRSYGDHPKPPFYFEAKHKVRQFSKKVRGQVSMPNWPELFENADLLKEIAPESYKNVKHFIHLAGSYNVEPVILTQYRRRAFLSTIDQYARVTFDRDMRFQRELNWNVIPDDRQMQHYDDPDCFGIPMTNVVLELKCEQRVPLWMIDMIRRFELTRSAFSKYGSAMERQYLSHFGREATDMHPALDFAPLTPLWTP
jgi:SPX domain protein involved in polyphosphate accumulation